jgi:hypothetical protein
MYVILRFAYRITQRVIQAHGTAMRRYTTAHPELTAGTIAARFGVEYQTIGNLRRGSRAPEPVTNPCTVVDMNISANLDPRACSNHPIHDPQEVKPCQPQ